MESEYETPILDNVQHDPDNYTSPETTVRHDIPNDGLCTIPGTIQEDSPEILPHTDETGDGTDTDHYMEPDAEVNSEQLNPSDINPRSTKYDLPHNPKAKFNEDYRYWITILSRNNYVHHTWILEKCYGTLTENLTTYS